ncbi:hypothetical protein C0995_012758 [Termitomyces sp. Mi166|nr:hypothetical protein C0995_012758 [Termitomyces sp. Mi166\
MWRVQAIILCCVHRKTTSKRVAKAPTDPVKLAQFRKVELIKMRHRAISGDLKEGPQSVPFDQRLHLKFKGGGDEENVLWFRKSLQLNKILDNGDREVLGNNKPIGDLVEDGDTVTVTYVRST